MDALKLSALAKKHGLAVDDRLIAFVADVESLAKRDGFLIAINLIQGVLESQINLAKSCRRASTEPSFLATLLRDLMPIP